MATEPLVVIGAGGFGREALDVAEAMSTGPGRSTWQIRGVVDDAPSAANLRRLAEREVPYLGNLETWLASYEDAWVSVAVGSPSSRRVLSQRVEHARRRVATLVHPEATLGSRCRLGPGSIVCAGARISTSVVAGRHLHVNANAIVGHDTVLGDYVSLNPSSAVAGDCTVGDEVLVGIGATILNGLTIGRRVTVGGGACVVRDVEPACVVKGVPAR